jgi:hypothetical protein
MSQRKPSSNSTTVSGTGPSKGPGNAAAVSRSTLPGVAPGPVASTAPTSPAAGAAAPAGPVRGAAIVVTGGQSYPMFEIRELRGDGALLSGPLLLEVTEELTLRLQPSSGAPLDLRARVTSVDSAVLAVSFVDLSPADRQRLQALRA